MEKVRRNPLFHLLLSLLLVVSVAACKAEESGAEGSGKTTEEPEGDEAESGTSSEEGSSAGEESAEDDEGTATAPSDPATGSTEPTDANNQPSATGGEYEHVPNVERREETETSKAERVLRQMTNYMMGVASGGEPPADQEAAAAALLEKYQLEWPKDPWGALYVYETDGAGGFEIYSTGPDGEQDTADDIRVSK